MKLTICGTAAGAVTAQRANSGYILQSDGHTIMLDCGPGSVRNALVAGIQLSDIEAVFLSHMHEDHCFDLGVLRLQAMYRRFERMPTIYAPPGSTDTVTYLMKLHRPGASELPLEVVELGDDDERQVCGFTVCSKETPHATGMQSFSRRFTSAGRNLVFSGDTAPNPGLMTVLARDADLLLHEAHTRAGLERYAADGTEERRQRVLERMPVAHSNLRNVAAIARDANAKRLVITHILRTENDEDMTREASEIYKGDLTIGRDGMVIEI
jgi:ribonuclease BN (tRNA processing enzyme)